MSVKPLLDAFRDYLSLRDEATVREWLDPFDWNLSERNLEPNDLPVTRFLDGLTEHCKPAEKRLVQQFIDFRDKLRWGQTYTADDFGADFIANYGWVEMIGTRGHFASDNIGIGVVFFGPNTLYPQHWHVAEELYFPLTGNALWSRDDGPYEPRASGECVFHESNMPHSMKTEDTPLLALYVWQGGDLAQKSDF